MMGKRLVMQGSLFYEFRIEDHVPPDHLVRSIDSFEDCWELRQPLASFYGFTGRPSADPELGSTSHRACCRVMTVKYAAGAPCHA